MGRMETAFCWGGAACAEPLQKGVLQCACKIAIQIAWFVLNWKRGNGKSEG